MKMTLSTPRTISSASNVPNATQASGFVIQSMTQDLPPIGSLTRCLYTKPYTLKQSTSENLFRLVYFAIAVEAQL